VISVNFDSEDIISYSTFKACRGGMKLTAYCSHKCCCRALARATHMHLKSGREVGHQQCCCAHIRGYQVLMMPAGMTAVHFTELTLQASPELQLGPAGSAVLMLLWPCSTAFVWPRPAFNRLVLRHLLLHVQHGSMHLEHLSLDTCCQSTPLASTPYGQHPMLFGNSSTCCSTVGQCRAHMMRMPCHAHWQCVLTHFAP
jgi:hypothetical protein